MSNYLELLAVQRPFPIGLDKASRIMFSVNFVGYSVGTVTAWEEEVAKLLSNAGLATLSTDTFIGPAADIPTGNGPYISIIDTGGSQTKFTHNNTTYECLSVQIIVRASTYVASRTRILNIWRALDGKRNFTVVA